MESSSDCNGIRTHNHLVRKRTLNYLAKWLSWNCILIKNNYFSNFIDFCLKSFLNNLYTPKVSAQTIPKRDVLIKLPCLGSTSFHISKKLQKIFTEKLKSCNWKIIFTSPIRVKSFLTFKDKLSETLCSWLVYKYKRGGCNPVYYSKTKHFNVGICKHFDISYLTDKKLKTDKNNLTAIQEYLLFCDYYPTNEDFSFFHNRVMTSNLK